MAANDIDEVSVRLTANAVDLLSQTDDAINKVEDKMDRLGSEIEDGLTGALNRAGQAVLDFADEFGVSIEEAAATLSNIGGLGEMFGFDKATLEGVANGIRDKIIMPVEEAVGAMGYLAGSAEDAAGAMDGMPEPVTTARDVLRELGQDVPIELESGVIQPMEKATEITKEFGSEVETVVGQEVPTSFEAAAESVDEFGQKVDEAFEGIDFEGVSQEVGHVDDEWTALMKDLRVSASETGTSIEETARRWEGSLLSMGLTAKQLEQVAAGSFEAVKEEINAAVFEIEDAAARNQESIEKTANRLEHNATTAMMSADALIHWSKGAEVMTEKARMVIEAQAAMRENLEFIPEHLQAEYLPMIEAWNELIETNVVLTEDHIEVLDRQSQDIATVAGFYEQWTPLIEGVTQRLTEMGGVAPNPVQIQKYEQMAMKLFRVSGSAEEAQVHLKTFSDDIMKTQARTQGLGDDMGILGEVIEMVGGRFGNMGVQFLKAATSAAKVLVVLKALQVVGKAIGEMADKAIAFNRVLVQTSVALALNAAATDEVRMTTAEFSGLIDEIATKFALSEERTLKAANAFLLMNQNMNLSNDQLLQMTEQGAAMASVFDKDVNTVLSNLGNYISSGMKTGLDDFALRLGESAQRAAALALNLGDDLDALTENEMAMVRYQVVLGQTDQFIDAAAASVGSMGKQLDLANEKIEDAGKLIGNIFAPAIVAMKVMWGDIVETASQVLFLFFDGAVGLASVAIGSVMAFGATVVRVINDIKEGTTQPLKEYARGFKQAFNDSANQLYVEGLKRMTGATDELDTAMDGLADSTSDAGGELDELASEMADAFIDAANDFDEGMAKIAQRYEDTMDDISRRAGQQRRDAQLDLERDLRDIDQDAAQDRLDAIMEYQIDEIRLREDFQKDIHQLEERFVLDLEDAVRERDARGVLTLQRRFNLEKKQRTEDYTLRQKRLKEDFKLELREIEKQRLVRRQQRVLEFQEELLDLEEQTRRREEQALIARNRSERDLLEGIKRRLMLLADAATKELEVEAQKLQNLYNALNAAYGPNGWIEQLYTNSLARQAQQNSQMLAQSSNAAAQQQQQSRYYLAENPELILANRAADERDANILAGFASRDAQADRNRFGSTFQQGYQRGGSFIATSPEMIGVGEGRPERVDVTPLSGAGGPSAGFRGGGGDKVEIELNVNASEMLTIEVADQTMSEIADVIVTLNQRSERGGFGA